jgi:uncharacterized double-CXXCG motif protein
VKFYLLDPEKAPRYKGDINAAHQWGLPGVHCPACGAIWSKGSDAYPSVDLSSMPERKEFERPRPEPFAEFARLRELVRPWAPPGIPLWPGTKFGPLVGAAAGTFGPFFFQNPWTLLARRETLERLEPEGLRGLKGCRTELRFRKKEHPELLEFELHPFGQLHADCLPPDLSPPCGTCGRQGLKLPEGPILEAASLPTHVDLFRLAGYMTLIISTERFAEVVLRLGLGEGEIVFRELPVR